MEKKFCGNCGTQLEPGSVFCGNCGNRVPQGVPMTAGTQNTQFRQPPAPPTPVPPAPTPAPPAPKKSGNTLLIVMLAVLAVVAICAVFLLTAYMNRENDSDKEEDRGVTEQTENNQLQVPTEGTQPPQTEPVISPEETMPATEPTQPLPTVEPVYLTDLPYLTKYGKLWIMSEQTPEVFVHTDVSDDAAYKDTDTPGHVTGPVYDYLGNRYTCGLFIDGTELASYYVSYDIGGNYTTFSGKISMYPDLAGTSFARDFSKCVEIYGDGVLLYRSSPMSQGEAVQSFTVDITGVQTLTIMYPETKGQSRLATVYDGKLE